MYKRIATLIFGLIGALIAVTPVARASVNDFIINSYTIDYRLSRDAENRSQLTTKETIVANFPMSNQNHGIERAIPRHYDGHPTSLKIRSVTDEKGKNWNYSTYDSAGNEVVRIGDEDTYVHGKKVFILTYDQRDVTKSFRDTNSDEFYWDTNGTGWRVPINNLSVSLNISEDIKTRLNDSSACYRGSFGSTQKCSLTKNSMTYSTNASSLAPGENMTIAVGFQPETFAAYKMSTFDKVKNMWMVIQTVLLAVSVPVSIWLVLRYHRWSNRTRELHPIVAEYLPPKNASVEISAQLVRSPYVFAAQLIDLAVRHYLKIYQTKMKKSIFSSDEYSIEIVRSIDDLRPEEQEILRDIFMDNVQVGSKLEMKSLKNNMKVLQRMQDNAEKTKKLLRGRYNLRQKVPAQSAWFRRASIAFLVGSLLLLSPVLLVMSLVAFAMSYFLWPLTDEGLLLVRYLAGLKQYISVAEKDRLNMLQSPEGAAKVAVNTNDNTQLIKLYERVLPYAVLFGQQKEWNQQLGRYYESANVQPDWYVPVSSMAVFNASNFSSAMNSFSSTAASSSSSGGSSGGGSSGGGGGGGGGGGW